MPPSIACAPPTRAISSSRRWTLTPPAIRRRPPSTWSTPRASPIRGWSPISTWCTNDPPRVRAVPRRGARGSAKPYHDRRRTPHGTRARTPRPRYLARHRSGPRARPRRPRPLQIPHQLRWLPLRDQSEHQRTLRAPLPARGPQRCLPALPAAARHQSRAAHPDSVLRRHHPEIARRLRRSLRGPQARAARGNPPAKPHRPGHLRRSARPPLPAPEKHRRDLVPGASHRPGNLRVPAGPQVIVMRIPPPETSPRHCRVAFQAAMTPFMGAFFAFSERANLALLSLVLAFLRAFLRLSAPPRQSHSLHTLTPLLFGLALCASQALPQQPPQNRQRDLKVEKLYSVPAPSAKPLQIPVSYAVIVGISRYRNLADKEQLQFAERDAQAIFTALISPEGGNFRVENVHMLTNEKATLAAVRREIGAWLPGVAREDDRVLIYFAGHGFMDQGKGYLAPYDLDRDRIADTGYPMDELGSVIGGKIKAKSKILLTDACHSGAITPEDTENINQTLGDLNKSLFSLTASRAREQSFEVADLKGGHGVFTYYVVAGLEGAADTSGDGVVTADELAEYVHTQVREYTSNRQNPPSDKANYDPDMLLAYVPSKARPAAAPAPRFGALIFKSNMDGVEVFVDGQT